MNMLTERARHLQRQATPERVACGLGWFSIALGVAELVMPATVARVCGMKPGNTGILRLYGLREIAMGVGILRSRNAAPYLWGRVGGDMLDMVTLVAASGGRERHALARTGAALANVAAVTALDVYAAQTWHQPPGSRRAGVDYPDYGDRSGFPQPAEAMRGAARADFTMPRDIRGPDALQPWVDGKPASAGNDAHGGGQGPATTSASRTQRDDTVPTTPDVGTGGHPRKAGPAAS